MTKNMMNRSIAVVVLVLLAGGVAAARADQVDYQYRWNVQSQTFMEIWDPLGWGEPEWQSNTELRVPNEAKAEPWRKDVHVTIDYSSPDAPSAPPGTIWVAGPNGTPILASEWAVKLNPDDNSEMWSGTFYLPDQPCYENVGFEEAGYRTGAPLNNGYSVDFIDVSTRCIPEPATMSLLAVGGLAMLRRRTA